MPTGGANNNKQSKITFAQESRHNERDLPHGGENAKDNTEVTHKSKRLHSELERGQKSDSSGKHLQLPTVTPSASTTDLDFAESRDTVIISDREEGPLEDLSGRRTPAEEDAERIHVVRLERLCDKSDR